MKQKKLIKIIMMHLNSKEHLVSMVYTKNLGPVRVKMPLVCVLMTHK